MWLAEQGRLQAVQGVNKGLLVPSGSLLAIGVDCSSSTAWLILANQGRQDEDQCLPLLAALAQQAVHLGPCGV